MHRRSLIGTVFIPKQTTGIQAEMIQQSTNRNPVFTNFTPHRFFNDYHGKWYKGFDEERAKDTPIQLFKVSGKTAKQLEGSNAKHISSFFSTLEDNKWTMNEHVREWFTECMLPEIPDWVFDLREVDPQYRDVYERCVAYAKKYRNHSRYFDTRDSRFKDVINTMRKMHDMQVFMMDTDDADAIKAKSMELFKVADVDATIMMRTCLYWVNTWKSSWNLYVHSLTKSRSIVLILRTFGERFVCILQ